MKKLISLVLAAVMSVGMAATAMAADINVSVDGKAVAWTDAKPFIKDGRTLVPLRPIANALGLGVSWNADAQQAGFSNGETTVVFELNSKEYVVFYGADLVESEVVKMDTAAISEGGRTYAPAKYLAQAFGYTVGWDQATQTVKITSGDAPVVEEEKQSIANLDAVAVDSLNGSRWTFCGAIIDGQELTQAEYEKEVEYLGGFMELFFFSENGVELNQGAVQFQYGTYEKVGDDGYGVVFNDGSTFACVFTESEGELVLLLMPDATGQNALYFKQ